MALLQDPQAIIAIVGIFVTLPPTIYIIYKCHLRRNHVNRTGADVVEGGASLGTHTNQRQRSYFLMCDTGPDKYYLLSSDLPLLSIQPPSGNQPVIYNRDLPRGPTPQPIYFHRRTTLTQEEGVIAWSTTQPPLTLPR
jgi:hypothetical protein